MYIKTDIKDKNQIPSPSDLPFVYCMVRRIIEPKMRTRMSFR